eukprot:Phypoly_transcript_23638.p1 GENE.Phypoly_transcript_23638~~Phypoly_transcript_23638.p1  ORF type:complete len:152 (+),score=19.87 Phypoly_transcript_23638:63-518(+)
MKAALVSLLVLALLLGVQSTNIVSYNYCGGSFELYKTDNGGGSYSVGTMNPNGGSIALNGVSGGFNLKAGAGGLTLAEFNINAYAGQDYYDVSVIVGKDVTMVIKPPESSCPTALCTANSCQPPGAYVNPNDKSTLSCATGGTFSVYFCAQ